LLVCFHIWRGPFGEPSSSGQYSSKRNLLSPSELRPIPSSWSRIENCAALGSCGLTDHSASERSQPSPATTVWREMSTRQTGADGGEGDGGGGEGDGGGGEGDGESAPISTGSHCGGIATGWLASASLLATLGLVMCGRKVARKAAATPMRTSTPKLEASFFACIG
jgi:hypothetical protein